LVVERTPIEGIPSCLERAPDLQRQQPVTRVPAPRVRVTITECYQAIEPVLDEAANLEDFHAAFLAAFGTTERVIAEGLFQQVLGVFCTEPTKPLDTATANLVLALLHRIGPKDELEAMLACQLFIVHTAAGVAIAMQSAAAE
jgi:hypothetical protein